MNSVVQANLDLLGSEARITITASVLAREAYFGEKVMAQCTAQGMEQTWTFGCGNGDTKGRNIMQAIPKLSQQ